MQIIWDGKKVYAEEAQTTTALLKGQYGENRKGAVFLQPEEALYLMDVRGGVCVSVEGSPLTFNELATELGGKKLMARYLTYKDWRDRGLFIRPASEAGGKYGRTVVREYKKGEFSLEVPSCEGAFFEDDLITTLDNYEAGKELYEKYWIGQLGTYKASHRGVIAKLDVLETLFLMDKGKLTLTNSNRKKVYAAATNRIEYFPDLYNVYSDWMEEGYVVKSGFKFGTHFRIYLPGAGPLKGEEWVHSKHVLHAFPRKSKLLISEWSRAIRVAHSVKKTFILAIPGKGKTKKGEVDFALYHRNGLAVETPRENDPSFLMLSLSEDEYIGGEELASSLKTCEEKGLDLLLGIADRETSVTYYLIRRIKLPGSKYEYYEIEWMQP